MRPLLLSASLESILLFAGHTDSQYQFREPRGDDGGGIGLVPIAGVALLAVVAVALLVGLDRPVRLKSVAPAALMAAILVTPLVVWTASSRDGEKGLIVERGTNAAGTPELIVSVADRNLNTLDATKGKRTVRLECLGGKGQVVLDAMRRWPFVDDRGFEYPHAHQRTTSEQLQQAQRCRLHGTRTRLEAEVEGPLRPARG